MITDSITIGEMNNDVSPVTLPTAAVKNTDTTEQQITFPYKLYEMLEYACDSESNSACSWSADGNAFVIINRNVMMKELVPKFFRQTKFRSFTRQLNLWGFVRHGTMWRHTLGLFHREKTHLLDQMHRIAIKSRGLSAAAKSCNPRVVTSPTHLCDSATSPCQFPVTPVAVGSVFDYFNKPAINPSAQEADLAANISQSHSSDETVTTQESFNTKSQTNEGMYTEVDNTLSCTNDDLLCLAASLFEQNEGQDDSKNTSTLR